MNETLAPDGTRFVHASDLSGKVQIIAPDDSYVEIEASDLLFLVRRCGVSEMSLLSRAVDEQSEAIRNLASFVAKTADPGVIDIVAPGEWQDVPMGIQLVAVDTARLRWTVVEGRRKARCNKVGAWHIGTAALTEDFVFTLDEAKALVAQLTGG